MLSLQFGKKTLVTKVVTMELYICPNFTLDNSSLSFHFFFYFFLILFVFLCLFFYSFHALSLSYFFFNFFYSRCNFFLPCLFSFFFLLVQYSPHLCAFFFFLLFYKKCNKYNNKEKKYNIYNRYNVIIFQNVILLILIDK